MVKPLLMTAVAVPAALFALVTAGAVSAFLKVGAAARQLQGTGAADLGALMQVSAQTVYNWEAEKSRPRARQLEAFAALKGVGKRQVKARLQELAAY